MIACLSSKIKTVALPLILFSAILSCKQEIGTVGADFIAIRNGFETSLDSININAYTVKMDSIPTHRMGTNYSLGSVNDVNFGINKSDLVYQVSLPVNQFTWGGATKLDSVIMRLRLKSDVNYYGNKNAVRTFKIYQLNEDLSYDSIYFSNRKYLAKATEVGSFTGKINVTDSSKITLGSRTITLPPHIAIPFNETFKTLLFGAEARSEFINVTSFKSAFKGFVVVDESVDAANDGVIFYLNPYSLNSALYAYYNDSMQAEFYISENNEVVYNYYEQKNVPNSIRQAAFQGAHRDTGYLQSLGGLKLRVELPEIFAQLSNRNLAIQGATITFSVLENSDNGFYSVPSRLFLTGSDSLGVNIFLKDQFFEGDAYYGGYYNSINKTYSFNIARHLQYLLNEYKLNRNVNYGMNLIIPANNPFFAGRLMLDTRKNASKLKLKLTYTVVK